MMPSPMIPTLPLLALPPALPSLRATIASPLRRDLVCVSLGRARPLLYALRRGQESQRARANCRGCHASARLCHPADCRKRAERLREIAEVEINHDSSRILPKSKLVDAAKRSDILLCLLHDVVDRDVLAANPNLKAIASMTITPDRIDVGRGDHAQDHRHQHPGRGDRRHRRSRLRVAARLRAPHRRRRPGGALGRVSGLAIESSRRQPASAARRSVSSASAGSGRRWRGARAAST